MIGGNPLHYFLTGMAGTFRQAEFAYNYWDYAYRGLISMVIAAKALGQAEIVDQTYKYIKHFETTTGDTGSGDPEKLMKSIKGKKV